MIIMERTERDLACFQDSASVPEEAPLCLQIKKRGQPARATLSLRTDLPGSAPAQILFRNRPVPFSLSLQSGDRRVQSYQTATLCGSWVPSGAAGLESGLSPLPPTFFCRAISF